MAASILAVVAVLVTMASISTAAKDPLTQCNYLDNPNLAPLIFLSQSEVAVIASYSSVDYASFNKGLRTDFFITPHCFVKGYSSEIMMHIYSGDQKCKITRLSPLVEFPSLFFLRKDPATGRWILLNSGEYQHQADTSGLMFGVGPSGNDFPQTCGLERRRIPVDEKKCESGTCLAYCSYALAPSNDCKTLKSEMNKYMPKEDIPKEVPALDQSILPVTTTLKPAPADKKTRAGGGPRKPDGKSPSSGDKKDSESPATSDSGNRTQSYEKGDGSSPKQTVKTGTTSNVDNGVALHSMAKGLAVIAVILAVMLR